MGKADAWGAAERSSFANRRGGSRATLSGSADAIAAPAYKRLLAAEPYLRRSIPTLIVIFLLVVAATRIMSLMTLRDDIEREQSKFDEDTDAVVEDRVRDEGDDSVADLLVDLDLSEIDRDLSELEDIQAALARIEAGTYGYCIDCGEPIYPQRLERLPAAARDLACQERFEAQHGADTTPSL